MLQGAKLVQNASERPHIRRVVVRLGLADFRGHIVGGALNGERLIVSILEHFRDTEVT